MAVYTQESISNSVFMGTCANGMITISGYSDVNTSLITANSLRGSLIICKGSVIGYVANNTAWSASGIIVYVAYSGVTISGITDIQFVFPIGRTSMKMVPINILACGMHDYSAEMAQPVLSMGQSPIGYDSYQASLKIKTNRNNAYDNETTLASPSIIRARKGYRVAF